MSSLQSGSLHAFSPVPADLIAFPPISQLDPIQTAQLEALQPGQITYQFFPPMEMVFPIDADWAPLADPNLEKIGGINPPGTRAYNERLLNSAVGRYIEHAAGNTADITSLKPCTKLFLGWAQSAIGPSLEVIGDQNDYWSGVYWKYERAFFVTDDSLWFLPHSYVNGQNPIVEREDSLWELATKLSTSDIELAGDGLPAITSNQLPAITRYYCQIPAIQASELTTKQADTIYPVPNLQLKAAALTSILPDNNGFFPEIVVSDVVNNSRSFNSEYPKPYPGQYFYDLRRFYWFTGSKPDMGASAFGWSNKADYTSITNAVASKWNFAQRGVFVPDFGCAFNPMYEVSPNYQVIPRAFNTTFPARNIYAFGDFHGLSYCFIDDTVPSWYTLCKVQNLTQYLQVTVKHLQDYFGDQIDFVGCYNYGEELSHVKLLSQQQTSSLVINLSMANSNGNTFFEADSKIYCSISNVQLFGFSVEQAQKQFDNLYRIGDSVITPLSNKEFIDPPQTLGFGISAIYNNYKVVTTYFDGRPGTVDYRSYSGYFPYDLDDSPFPLRPNRIYFLLFSFDLIKSKNQSGYYYDVSQIVITESPYMIINYDEYFETWEPVEFVEYGETGILPAFVVNFANCVANFYTDLINSVAPCGTFEIHRTKVEQSESTLVTSATLFGLPQVGTLRIKWTAREAPELTE